MGDLDLWGSLSPDGDKLPQTTPEVDYGQVWTNYPRDKLPQRSKQRSKEVEGGRREQI